MFKIQPSSVDLNEKNKTSVLLLWDMTYVFLEKRNFWVSKIFQVKSLQNWPRFLIQYKSISRYPPLLLIVSIEFFDEDIQNKQNLAHTFWVFWKNYILKVFYTIAKLFKMQFLQNNQKVCARFWLFCISSSKKSIETIRSNGGYREMDYTELRI